MRALEFLTGHVIYNPAYTYKFKLKTTQVGTTVPPSNSNSQENEIHQIEKNGLFQIGEDEQDNNSSSLSSESDLAESPAGQTIRSSYKSPIFDQHHLEPCPVNGCPLNPQSRVMNDFSKKMSTFIFDDKYIQFSDKLCCKLIL